MVVEILVNLAAPAIAPSIAPENVLEDRRRIKPFRQLNRRAIDHQRPIGIVRDLAVITETECCRLSRLDELGQLFALRALPARYAFCRLLDVLKECHLSPVPCPQRWCRQRGSRRCRGSNIRDATGRRPQPRGTRFFWRLGTSLVVRSPGRRRLRVLLGKRVNTVRSAWRLAKPMTTGSTRSARAWARGRRARTAAACPTQR